MFFRLKFLFHIHVKIKGAVTLKTHIFPCFLCVFRHYFFVPAIDNEKKGLPLCIFLCIRNSFLMDAQPPRPLPKTFRKENEKSRQFSSTKRKERTAEQIPSDDFCRDSIPFFIFHSSLFTFILPPGWEQGASGSKVKHGALHGTIVYLSLSVIVVCSPHPPLRGPPSPLGKALKEDQR